MNYNIEELAKLGVEYLDDRAKIFVTSNGPFVFTGSEFIAISEPDTGLGQVEADAQFKGTGMTIKDVARHKDIVKLEKRVAKLENAMDSVKGLGGRHFGIDWRGI